MPSINERNNDQKKINNQVHDMECGAIQIIKMDHEEGRHQKIGEL